MKRAKLEGNHIGAIYTGSESHPYAVKPTSTIVAEAIGATPNLTQQTLTVQKQALPQYKLV